MNQEIIYGKEFIYHQYGNELKRFFEFKICALPECGNQVKVKMYQINGKDRLPSNKRFDDTHYCCKSCARKDYKKPIKSNPSMHMNLFLAMPVVTA